MQKYFLSDLCCPKAMLDSKIVNLKSVENNLISTFDKYPLHDGVPDLRLANDRSYTPYDTVLREAPKISHSSDKKDYIKAMKIKKEQIYGKKILVAGVAGGFDLDVVLSFKPKKVYAIDFSNTVISLSKYLFYKNKNIQFIIGDLCNLPFKNNIFDYVINSAVMQHTRAPELAHRNIWRTLKKGGYFNYGNVNIENIHNTRVVLDRLKYKYHRMDTEKAKKKLRTFSILYNFLIKTRILKFINRKHFRFPFLLELAKNSSQNSNFFYRNALNYYLVSYRHLLDEKEYMDIFKRTGCEVKRTPKGFLGIKK